MLYYNLVIARSGLSLSFFLGFFTLLLTKKRVARKYGYHFQRHFLARLALQWQRAWDCCCCRVLPAFITTFKTLCKSADRILNNNTSMKADAKTIPLDLRFFLVNKNWCNIGNIGALYIGKCSWTFVNCCTMSSMNDGHNVASFRHCTSHPQP